MSTSPARITSRRIILAASAMSMRSVLNSPAWSGWTRSCWSRNWERVCGSSATGAARRLVREPAHVLVSPRRRHGRAGCRERAGHEGRMTLGERARVAHRELFEQEAELLLERRADRGARLGRQPPQLALVGAKRLLARLVEELLVGVA